VLYGCHNSTAFEVANPGELGRGSDNVQGINQLVEVLERIFGQIIASHGQLELVGGEAVGGGQVAGAKGVLHMCHWMPLLLQPPERETSGGEEASGPQEDTQCLGSPTQKSAESEVLHEPGR